MGAALRGVAAAVAPSMLDGKLGQVTFRIFSTLLFLNTATTDFSGQFSASATWVRLYSLTSLLVYMCGGSDSGWLNGGGECGAARCFAEPRDLKTATFDLLFEVKQLGLNWTTRYILKFGLNLRFTALYVLCVKLLVSTIAQGIYSLSVAPPYELLTEIPTFFSVCNKSHDSCKIKLQFGWKMSLMSKKSEFSSQGCAIVRQCGEMKANVLGLGVLPRLTHHQLLDRDGAERSTAHHKQKNSQPLLKKGWRSPRF